MPAKAHEGVGLRDAEAIPNLRAPYNPRAAVAEALAHLADGHVHRVTRDGGAAPRLLDELVEGQEPSGVRDEGPQRRKGLGPHFDFDAVAQQSAGCAIELEGAEGEILHRARMVPESTRRHSGSPQGFV